MKEYNGYYISAFEEADDWNYFEVNYPPESFEKMTGHILHWADLPHFAVHGVTDDGKLENIIGG